MTADVLLVVAGAVPSLLASVLFWLYLARWRVPRIEISDIKIEIDAAQVASYRVWIRNVHGRRAILEPIVKATFRTTLPGRSTMSVWDVPLSNTNVLQIRPEGSRIVSLKFDDLSEFALASLSDDLAADLRSSSPGSIDKLFALGDNPAITIEATAADELSGARRYFARKVRLMPATDDE